MPDRDWTLVGFTEVLDRWIEIESITDDTILIVLDWIMSRFDDPYQGVQRVEGFPNLWFGRVPRTADSKGRAVACSYWI